MADYTWRQGDTYEPIVVIPRDASGAVIDLTDTTDHTFRMATLVNNVPTVGVIDDATATTLPSVTIGTVTGNALAYDLTSLQAENVGDFAGTFSFLKDGEPLTVPTEGWITLKGVARLP